MFYYPNTVSLFIGICVALARGSVQLDSQANPFQIDTPRQAEIVGQVIKFLENNYRSNISSEEVVKRLNLNYAYICRVFKKAVGMTITEYIHYLRINQARSLLVENTGLNGVAEVADFLGYENPAYFSRVFRAYEGMSPRQFIRNAYHSD